MKAAAIPTPSPETRVTSFIKKFTPANQTFIRSVRNALRKRLPAANELVYDNYNFFVIGYCTTDRPSDALLSPRRRPQRRRHLLLLGRQAP
jgi:hypothetical protein